MRPRAVAYRRIYILRKSRHYWVGRQNDCHLLNLHLLPYIKRCGSLFISPRVVYLGPFCMIRCRDVLVSYSLRPYLFEACWLIFFVHVCGYCAVLLPHEF